jgi:hypothetical protein
MRAGPVGVVSVTADVERRRGTVVVEVVRDGVEAAAASSVQRMEPGWQHNTTQAKTMGAVRGPCIVERDFGGSGSGCS